MEPELQETFDDSEAAHGGDSALSPTGERQLRFLLGTTPADLQTVPPHVVYTSPLQRALRTALTAYPSRRIVVDPRLREVDTRDGMMLEELRGFVAAVAPDRKAKTDLSKVPDATWWGSEEQSGAAARAQSLLKEILKTTSKGKAVALVCHGGIIRAMAGELKPFPKIWGVPRAFPRNMKPYFATVDASTPTALKILPASPESANVVLLRHAHLKAQAAVTLQKKIQKFKASSNKSVDAAAALDKQIRRFNMARKVKERSGTM